MNKELIDKNICEFMHWLRGGNILAQEYCYDEYKYSDWSKVPRDSTWDYSNIYKPRFVINDEYVEFRKALAEGKTVQEQDYYSKQWLDMKTDSFHKASDTQYAGVYRIKPEEPKFKVGDWVVNKTSKQRIVKKVTSTTYSDTVPVGNTEVGINVMLINDLELWQPKKGEWCWFWDEILKNPMLLQFERFCSTDFYKYETNNKLNYQYCEPFLGQLPTNLQEAL